MYMLLYEAHVVGCTCMYMYIVEPLYTTGTKERDGLFLGGEGEELWFLVNLGFCRCVLIREVSSFERCPLFWGEKCVVFGSLGILQMCPHLRGVLL